SISDSEGGSDRYTADLGTRWNLNGHRLKYLEVGTRYETTKFSQTVGDNVGYGAPEPDYIPTRAPLLGVSFDRVGLGDIGRSGAAFPIVPRGVAENLMDSLAGFAASDPALVS